MRCIDLTYTVDDKMLVWPGNDRPVFQWKKRGNSETVNVTKFSMESHTGTHVDSPLHFLMDGPPLDQLPVDHFFGKARLFRFREAPNKQIITLKMVQDSGFSMGDADIFVMETGIQALAEQREYNYLFPIPEYDLLEWLIGQNIKCYMTDATCIDFPEEDKESPRHKTLFRSTIPVVENLKNLSELPENKTFIISAMPLKLAGREGSPCRAAAMLDD